MEKSRKREDRRGRVEGRKRKEKKKGGGGGEGGRNFRPGNL